MTMSNREVRPSPARIPSRTSRLLCPAVSPVTTATRPNPCARISLLHSAAWSGRVT